jgi:23S rRNA pseudouridine955/2504/2580 synthase
MSTGPEGRELVAGPEDAGRRLDKILRAYLGNSTLSEIYAGLRKGKIRVNGHKAEPELRLDAGDRIFLHSSLEISDKGGGRPAVSEDEGLREIAEMLILVTEDLIFVNKPRGELSQGPDGLEPRIRRALSARSSSSLSFVPGPLHRLDRNTSGILTFPRSAAGARAFSALIRERRIIKRYLALVDGELAESSEWRDRMIRDGKTRKSSLSATGDEALSRVHPLLVYGGRSLLLVELHTGLTHQIRAQSSARGFPLSGDVKYGGEPLLGGYILHALSLEFPEPPFADLPRLVIAPLPAGPQERLSRLFGDEALRAALAEAPEGRSRCQK